MDVFQIFLAAIKVSLDEGYSKGNQCYHYYRRLFLTASLSVVAGALTFLVCDVCSLFEDEVGLLDFLVPSRTAKPITMGALAQIHLEVRDGTFSLPGILKLMLSC